MNKIVRILLLLVVTSAFGQTKTPEEFGYRHIVLKYKSDNVDILIKSKKGEENVQKPLFFFCQGSLPQPLLNITQMMFMVFFHLMRTVYPKIIT
jgi:hypothetical protein